MGKASFRGTGTVTKKSDLKQALEALRAGKADVAETLCREHLNSHPASVEHLRLLGHALMQQQKFGDAEATLKIAIELAPDFPPLSEDLGSALAQQRKFEEAIPLFEQAVRPPSGVDGKRTRPLKPFLRKIRIQLQLPLVPTIYGRGARRTRSKVFARR